MAITNRRERGEENLAMLNSHTRKGRAHLPRVGKKTRTMNHAMTGTHEKRRGAGKDSTVAKYAEKNVRLRKIPTALWTHSGFCLRDPA